MQAAGRTFLLDVGNLAVCCDLAIPSGHAPAPECTEAQETNETHHANPHSLGQQFPYRRGSFAASERDCDLAGGTACYARSRTKCGFGRGENSVRPLN